MKKKRERVIYAQLKVFFSAGYLVYKYVKTKFAQPIANKFHSDIFGVGFYNGWQ